jgi:drug/metabolite transporter (DMT)-like permease
MLKALTPVVTLAAGCAFGLERPTPPLVAAVALITAGVMAAAHGEVRFSAFGAAAMVSSVGAEALRLVVMQLLMARRGMHPLEALMYLAPACAAWMLLICAASGEAAALLAGGRLSAAAAHPAAFAASALAGFAVNGCAFAVVGLSSALTLKARGPQTR